ncbi:hypothetical protein M0811_03745 [Anaeramoeba ignava]|uniref:Uncharacterized protein n=1 Tax=Anaeramoeba ignava TaxID=1746090 RepID=A0A9Q0RGN4_ANAIG|nr:hypothetical protein M0811_03745 [Anaeramoeba ignava]
MQRFFIVCGEQNAKKTHQIQIIFNLIKNKFKSINIGGFIQKRIYDSKNNFQGYDLLLLPEIKIYPFARIKPTELNKEITKEMKLKRDPRERFDFDNSVFKIVENQLKKLSGKTNIWIFDELSKLEAQGNGHINPIKSLWEKEKNSNSLFLFSMRDFLVPKIIPSILSSEKENDSIQNFDNLTKKYKIEKLQLPTDSQTIENFQISIINSLSKNLNFKI